MFGKNKNTNGLPIPNTRIEQFLNKIATGTGDYPTTPWTRIEQFLLWIVEHMTGGSYEDLTDLPKINGVELIGDKSGSDLGLDDYESLDNLPTINGVEVKSS